MAEGIEVTERTLVLIKPDAVREGLESEISKRFKKAGLELVARKEMQLDEELLNVHYAHHKGKPFFKELVEYMKNGTVVAMVWEGPNAVEVVRRICGATDPARAEEGTLRRDFGKDIQRNVVHASDSRETAAIEIKRFFGEKY